jgi:hypothetical protein
MSLGGYKGTRLTPGKKEKRHFVFIGFFQQRWRKFSSMRSALAFTRRGCGPVGRLSRYRVDTAISCPFQ